MALYFSFIKFVGVGRRHVLPQQLSQNTFPLDTREHTNFQLMLFYMSTFYLCRTYKPYTRYSRSGPATRRPSTGVHAKAARQTGWYVYTGEGGGGFGPATRRSSTGVHAKAARQTGRYVYYTGDGGISRVGPATRRSSSGVHAKAARQTGWYVYYTGDGGISRVGPATRR